LYGITAREIKKIWMQFKEQWLEGRCLEMEDSEETSREPKSSGTSPDVTEICGTFRPRDI